MRRVFCFLIVSLLFGLLTAAAAAQPLAARLQRDLGGAGGQVALVVVESSSGRVLFERNADVPLKPASTMKVLTSAAAYQYLGPEFNFKTGFYGRWAEPGRLALLVVRGGGDPRFRTEELWLAVRRLYQEGVRSIDRLLLDDTLFIDDSQRQGQRAYEAGSSALAFNYNSITFRVCPTRPGAAARVVVDPWETPLKFLGQINTTKGQGEAFGIDEVPGGAADKLSFRLRGSLAAGAACAEIYRSVPDPVWYLGQVLERHLQYLGITVSGPVERGRSPGNLQKLVELSSVPLRLLVDDLNHYSNNFMAEQLLLTLGCQGDGCRREQGLARLGRVAAAAGCGADSCVIADASGLSHDNRLTARSLAGVLVSLYQDPQVAPEFLSSLSVLGRSGTLKQRRTKGAALVLRAKTGTIRGVYSLTGFLTDRQGRPLSFALLQNGAESRDRAWALEDRVWQTLFRGDAD